MIIVVMMVCECSTKGENKTGAASGGDILKTLPTYVPNSVFQRAMSVCSVPSDGMGLSDTEAEEDSVAADRSDRGRGMKEFEGS